MKLTCFENTNTTIIKSTICGFHHPVKVNFIMMKKGILATIHPGFIIKGILSTLLLLSVSQIFCQSSSGKMVRAGNDLMLVRPVVNFNSVNGGYYSDYIISEFNYMYCGAVVNNNGSNPAYNVRLRVDFYDYNDDLDYSYFSDTLSFLDSAMNDTLWLTDLVDFQYWTDYYQLEYFIFSVEGDSLDDITDNNIDTVPFTDFGDAMWGTVGRASEPTGRIDLQNISGFQSGDFIGITVEFPNGGEDFAFWEIYFSAPIPDSVQLTGMVYEGNVPVYSEMIYISPGFTGWYPNPYYWLVTCFNPYTEYRVGVHIDCSPGTQVPIGIDTSDFHNFQAETAAFINGTWTSLNFVPLIRAVYNPEGIESQIASGDIYIYPNPALESISIIQNQYSMLDIFSLSGTLLQSMHCMDSETLDVSFLPEGMYFLRFSGEKGNFTKKLIIQK
ncbi:MAG: T9SS type A sorting domain-containing protein [Bacteroidota bacterium]